MVVVSQVPNLGSDPKACLTAPGSAEDLKNNIQPKSCVSVSRTTALVRLAFTDATILNVAKKQNVTALLPDRYFCDNLLQDEERCRALLNRTLLYEDETHLNEEGSIYLALRWEAEGFHGLQFG